MKFRSALLITLVSALAVSSFAQKTDPVRPEKLPSVNEILDKYVKALGGSDAIRKVKSRSSKGTVELSGLNVKGTFEVVSAAEGKSYSKTALAGVGEFVEATDGTKAWSDNPLQGSREKAGAELLQSRVINDFYRDIRLKKLFPKMELKGIEKVGERDTFAVVATAEGLPPETWYFDTQTGLMLRSDITAIVPEGNQKSVFYYEDQRPVDGIVIAHRVRMQTPAATLILTSTEIKHGVPVDETMFAKPKK